MKKPFNPPTVKHDIQLIKTMEPNAKGEMVEKHIVRVTGPGLPGIDYPYKDPSVPDVLKRYSLTDELNKPIKPPEKLWGNYWQTGQLCILAGDMGTGKSTVAIRLAKSLSLTPGPSPKERGVITNSPPAKEGNESRHQGSSGERGGGIELPKDQDSIHPLPHANGVSTPPLQGESRLLPKKVLFIGFELGAADMRMRYGEGEVSENFFYANISADAFASGRATLGERLVASLDEMVAETNAEVVIIDQPDRMHLQPAMWNYFMLKLNEMKVQKGISILITLNNKPRNLSKAPTISSFYKSNLLAPHADSIICLANHCRQEGKRYLKSLKNTALPLGENTLVEVLEIGLQNNEILLQLCGTEREEKVLMPTATERRNTLMITAEEMRYNGMSFRDIAQQMELPERTVRSWVSFIGERAVRSEGREVVSVEEREARSEEREGVSVEGGGVSEKHEEASSTPDTSGLTNPPIKSFSPVMVSVDEPQVEKEIPLTGSLRVGSEASINTTMPLRGSPTDAAVSTESPL